MPYLRIILTIMLMNLGNATLASTVSQQPTESNPHNLSYQARKQAPTQVPKPPFVHAQSWALMDLNSGVMIASKQENKTLEMASLTKLMSLYILSDALNEQQIHLDDRVRVSHQAWAAKGSKMFVKEGSYIPLEKLMHGAIVASGNDAIIALAEHLSGNEQNFVSLMNQTATMLDLKKTHFSNATGLPAPKHYSTAHDLAILSRALINNMPQHTHWYKQKWFTYNNIKQPNRNRLLWRDPSVTGLKTGHTKKAGYCLVATATRHHTQMLAVIMGAHSDMARFTQAEALLGYGFRYFEGHSLFNKNQPFLKIRIWQGTQKKVALGLTKQLNITISKPQAKNIYIIVQIKKNIIAPIKQGDPLAILQIKSGSHLITSMPLVALQNIPQSNVFARWLDSLSAYISNWFHPQTHAMHFDLKLS
jgi:serine-type D-Ala-D-Ala carboxypeptidase (penicillin-binding protein 5/6)